MNAPDSAVPAASTPKNLVVLVHGTFAYHEHDEASNGTEGRWWLRKSQFAQSLETNAPECEVAPAGQPVSAVERPWWYRDAVWRRRQQDRLEDRPPDMVFHWSGANSETARRSAGKRLHEHLSRANAICRARNSDLHVIAHSHGGQVLWEALCHDTEQETTSLDRLKTWTTVATPFFEFGPDWRQFWVHAFGLVFLALIWWWQGQWWLDFWGQQLIDELWGPILKATVASAYLFAALTTAALALRVIWAWYCCTLRVPPDSERQQQERQDLWSAVIGFAVVAAGFAAASFFMGTERICRLAREAWTSDLKWGVLLTLAYVTTTILAIIWGWGPIVEWRVRRKRRLVKKKPRTSTGPAETLEKKAWNRFKDKHAALPIGYESVDEAINALRATINPQRFRVLPRMPGPRDQRFSKQVARLLHPEREAGNQGIVPWLLTFALLPIAIVRDWVVRPLYNEVILELIEAYVQRSLLRKAQGNDLNGARLIAVRPLPVPLPVAVPPAAPNPASAAMTEALNIANKDLAAFRDRLRRLLALDLSEGLSFESLLREGLDESGQPRAPACDAPEISPLLHVSYFAPPLFAQEVAAWLKQSTPPPPPPRPRDPPPPRFVGSEQPTQLGFFSALLRWAVILAIIYAPQLVLAGWGYGLLWPASSANALKTLSDAELAISWHALIQDADGIEHQPQIFGTYLALVAVGGDAASSEAAFHRIRDRKTSVLRYAAQAYSEVIHAQNEMQLITRTNCLLAKLGVEAGTCPVFPSPNCPGAEEFKSQFMRDVEAASDNSKSAQHREVWLCGASDVYWRELARKDHDWPKGGLALKFDTISDGVYNDNAFWEAAQVVRLFWCHPDVHIFATDLLQRLASRVEQLGNQAHRTDNFKRASQHLIVAYMSTGQFSQGLDAWRRLPIGPERLRAVQPFLADSAVLPQQPPQIGYSKLRMPPEEVELN